MTRLRIDFAPPSLRRTLLTLSPALWGAGVLGLVLCLGAAANLYQLSRQRAAARQAQAAMARAVLVPPAPPALIAAPQAAAVNAAALQLNLPWRALREALAAATPSTVALLALELDAGKRRLTISAEARSGEAVVAYIEQLQAQEALRGVLLLRHDVDEADPDRPLRFDLQADWTAP